MLIKLTIVNYALIENLEMKPSAGLNIITGETGAGKSIMIGAVGLLLGNRADTRILYNESAKCVIEGIFDIREYNIRHFFDENDLDYQEHTIIRREISPAGKSRAFINDTPVNLDTLKELGSYLMEVHSQHDTLQLASNDYQISIIDAFAGHQDLLRDYQSCFISYKKAERELEQRKRESDEINREKDYNQFLLEELEKAQLQPGEQEELEEELKILEHGEEIKLKLNQALGLLNHSEISISSGLYETTNLIRQLKGYSEKFRVLGDRVESCLIEIKDIAEEIKKEESLVDYDPMRIEAAKERLSLIYNLQQKHRASTVGELLTITGQLREKLSRSQNLDEEIIRLKSEKEQFLAKSHEKAQKLSSSRISSFPLFSGCIQDLLKGLGMPNAILRIDRREEELSQNGIDNIRMLFSANKGVSPQELKHVASGGEFSRLMFCVKYVLAEKTALPTIVFDEVDTGISGETALKMVKMMEKMAQKHQALVITHLPQIAASGDHHYFVYKDDKSEKTVSKIRLLNKEERIFEIAKILSGENPSAAAMENAKELLSK